MELFLWFFIIFLDKAGTIEYQLYLIRQYVEMVSEGVKFLSDLLLMFDKLVDWKTLVT